MPYVYPASYRDRFHRQSWRTAIPAVQAVEIPGAEVMGRCEFVFTPQGAIHHDLYDFRVDLTGEEMHGLVSIETKNGLLVRYVKGCANAEVEGAIPLLGWPAANYVHWLTEYLSKLALVDEIPELADLPLIVDANLHPNILESLRLCNVHNRMLITLSPGEVLRLKRAIFITPTAYVPFDYRFAAEVERTGITPDRAVFVPRAVHALRNKLLSVLTERTDAGARRLFLRRNSHFRRMKNAEEVESLLRARGFWVVEPERLPFAEQVKLVATAEIIVAQAGAALGNMLFAPQGCHIVILSAWSPYNNYYYFSNLASILQQHCFYVLCDVDGQEEGIHPAHRSPVVDIQLLEGVIRQ
ncbi:MAG: glycosyltransferase 61 family protein [Pseudomonadota bacterium]